eukprot:12393575-Alexandrium_andersonii.AAC.1
MHHLCNGQAPPGAPNGPGACTRKIEFGLRKIHVARGSTAVRRAAESAAVTVPMRCGSSRSPGLLAFSHPKCPD